MISIARLLMQNISEGSITLPFPERQPIEGEYRGLVQNDPDNCTGCGLCAYVCTSSAIKVERTVSGFQWSYDPGQCTFCARCVQRCPKHSVSMEGTRPPIYEVRGELNQSYDFRKKKPAAAPAKPESGAVQ